MANGTEADSNIEAAGVESSPRRYPPGFRARRAANWISLGLLYTSFYLCRYNFSLANKAISAEFGFSREQVGYIITGALLAYALGQVVNGLLADRLGGKRAMLIGAVGTVVMNLLFGAASFIGLLWLFVLIRSVDGYLQAFGAPGMVKINTAWFAHRERGRFAGIFGFMINLGRFGIFKLGPALLAGFTLFGVVHVGPLHWRWLFWVPAGICLVMAGVMTLVVKETPEEAGFSGLALGAGARADATGSASVRADIREVFWRIVRTPTIWVIAMAYACTGAVRQAVDQWFPRFLQEVHDVHIDSSQFQLLAFLIPFVASVGSLLAGYLSDTVFRGRRAPVAMALYFLETAIILTATQVQTVSGAIVCLVLISFTANSTHSILGTAAAMDIGGRRMAGFAAGVIDSFQYLGGMLAGAVLGHLLDRSWDYYFLFMAPFGFVGGLLMISIRKKPLLGH